MRYQYFGVLVGVVWHVVRVETASAVGTTFCECSDDQNVVHVVQLLNAYEAAKS